MKLENSSPATHCSDSARDPRTKLINVVVDTPKGSRNKYKYDEKAHIWRLSKMLPVGASFPFDFGFIPSTKGEDGDLIDVLVVTEEAAFAGCVLPTLLIGVLEAEQHEWTSGSKILAQW